MVALLIAAYDFELASQLAPVMPLAVAMSLAYFALSLRFWFYLPATGIGIGGACFVLSWAIVVLS